MKKIGLFLSAMPYSAGTLQYNDSMLEAVLSLIGGEYGLIIAYLHPMWAERLEGMNVKAIHVVPNVIGMGLGRLLRVINFPVGILRKISSYFHPIARVLKRENCDLWIFPSQESLCYEIDVPAIGTIHDLMHRYEGRFPEVSDKGEFNNREIKFSNMCKWAKGILVDSKIGKEHVVESYNADPKKVFPLPFAPPKYVVNFSSSEGVNVSEKYNFPTKFIFFPAVFWEHKNHRNLISAVSELVSEGLNVNLVLLGDRNALRDEMGVLAAKLEIQKNVYFINYVPSSEIPFFYLQARALVFPTYFGPTNIPPLEALALGCPMAISNIYGMPEQVGDAALFFDPTSIEDIAGALRRIWSDDQLCQDLSVKAKAQSIKWGQKEFNQRLREIIHSVVGKNVKMI